MVTLGLERAATPYRCVMADRQRDPGWWLASDGKWYPPDLRTDVVVQAEEAFAPDTWEPHATMKVEDETVIPQGLTRLVIWGLVVASLLLLVAAALTFQYGSLLRSSSGMAVIEDAKLVADGWSGMGVLAMFIVGSLVLSWTFRTSRIMDARGASGRRWRGGWTIGSWFVPIASLILPRFVFAELEKISQVPFDSEQVDDRWKSMQRSTLGDLWWLLWTVSLVVLQVSQMLTLDGAEDPGTLATVATLAAVGYMALAGAGVTLALVVRNIERDSRR